VLAPLVLMARPLGLAPVQREDLAAAADLLDSLAVRCRPTSDTFVNPAKSLAVSLANTIPVAWGSTGLTGVAAYRLATQLAGNAGLPALSGTMPTAARLFGGVFDDAGAADGEDIFRDRIEEDEPRRPRLLLLREAEENPDIRAELAALMRALTDRGATYSELTAEVGGPVTGLASLIGLLDFVTVYTGLLLGVDPSGARIGQGAL
jgi:glucose/mannose-6-phosphate isomerase